MRTIRKRPQPIELTEWRVPRMVAAREPGISCDYESMRRSPDVLKAVENSLLAEQGSICAYTGHRISITFENATTRAARNVDFHIEHLMPQDYCKEEFGNYGMDADYQNLVACWPRPNCGFEPAYGAKKKDNWPSPQEQSQFVSPLRPDCSVRFRFNHHGEVEAANPNDQAAKITIAKLGLQHNTLNELRRAAIQGALNPASRQIKLSDARRLLARIEQATQSLEQGITATLRPFCFAIEAALRREIRKLEGIMNRR
jgi:uncharacterized protein (TIGR02646 family)